MSRLVDKQFLVRRPGCTFIAIYNICLRPADPSLVFSCMTIAAGSSYDYHCVDLYTYCSVIEMRRNTEL